MLKRLLMSAFIIVIAGCQINSNDKTGSISYLVPQAQIKVDGDFTDWTNVKENVVKGSDNLWFGQGMEPEKWKGDDDLSFKWKSAWYGNKLYFLVTVTDDSLQPCIREFSWLNDCVEIYLDFDNRGGQRILDSDFSTPIEERIGKQLAGYEMHFLPCDTPRVYLDDTLSTYRLENAQNQMFFNKWQGEIKRTQLPDGYALEIGMNVPNASPKPGKVMGLDVAVCDDDGSGRKGLMLWKSGQVDFWITMDHFGKIMLSE